MVVLLILAGGGGPIMSDLWALKGLTEEVCYGYYSRSVGTSCDDWRYGCRAMMLETMAAVPGMVGGMLLYCKSSRRFEHSGGVFLNAYFLAYLASPKLAHRITGYLEEEAVHSYTEFLKEFDKGNIENVKAPAIAIDYWRLPADATLRDVVMVVRADEAHHRDVNHFASDIHY
ncbi:alternative oxidase [Artemisia annua]|uniref:Ubiquinol oxidase n=1 Tax=Artemisia annua TaxID=35608 RepID=A0A2U1L7N7_ARTAN|nr:alternative oxidase [Artemisia annua]